MAMTSTMTIQPPQFSLAPTVQPSTLGFRPRRSMSALDGSNRTDVMGEKLTDRLAHQLPERLPEFSFNPGATVSADTSPIAGRRVGLAHRRGGSEWTGGWARVGEGEAPRMAPLTERQSEPDLGFPARPNRPRHAHRRSAAISSHDLNFMLQAPKNKEAVNSAPASPVAPRVPVMLPNILVNSEEVSPIASLPSTVASPMGNAAPAWKFETAEILPESPRESAPPVAISTPPRKVLGPSTHNKRMSTDSRPSTAGAVLDNFLKQKPAPVVDSSPRRRNSIPPPAAQPERLAKVEEWSVPPLSMPATDPQPTPLDSQMVRPGFTRRASNVSIKTRRKRGVRNWAGAFLGGGKSQRRGSKNKKSKSKSKSKQVSSSPVVAPIALAKIEDFDDEDSTGLATPTPGRTTFLEPVVKKSRSLDNDDDSSGPMIDLDAALRPIDGSGSDWEAAQRAAATTKRKLHSAKSSKKRNLQFHRRTESAPEMAPFEFSRFGVTELGSNSTMDDVFEEDEEEANETDTKESTVPSCCSSTVDLREVSTMSPVTPQQVSPMPSPVFPSKVEATPAASSTTSLSQLDLTADLPPFAPRDLLNEPCSTQSSLGQYHVDSPISTLSSRSPLSPHSATTSSPVSPAYDAQTIHTAPVAAENLAALLTGEPGPEVRRSLDISSILSLAVGDGHATSRPDARIHDQRPVSMSSNMLSRRRASLASLSRLISSSHGERSKLNTAFSVNDEKKPSRTKRLSRLVQFWRPSKSDAKSEA